MLRPRRLVKAERHARLVERLADQVAASRRHMRVHLSKDHHELAFNVTSALDRVVGLACAESRGMNIGGEVADGGGDAWVEGTAIGEVAA